MVQPGATIQALQSSPSANSLQGPSLVTLLSCQLQRLLPDSFFSMAMEPSALLLGGGEVHLFCFQRARFHTPALADSPLQCAALHHGVLFAKSAMFLGNTEIAANPKIIHSLVHCSPKSFSKGNKHTVPVRKEGVSCVSQMLVHSLY